MAYRLVFKMKVLIACAALAAAFLAPAEAATDWYNAWKDRCRKLDLQYAQWLKRAPADPVSSRELVRCSDPEERFVWEADTSNFNVLVTNLFYHQRKDQAP